MKTINITEGQYNSKIYSIIRNNGKTSVIGSACASGHGGKIRLTHKFFGYKEQIDVDSFELALAKITAIYADFVKNIA